MLSFSSIIIPSLSKTKSDTTLALAIISIFDFILIYLKKIESHQRAKEHAIISQEVNLDERI